MAIDAIRAVQVNIWGQFVGAVAPLRGKPGFYEFSYAPEFEKGRLELSPILMKMRSKRRFSFPSLAQESFHGLPGLLADALPDKFGNALIDEYLARRGIPPGDITSLQRLLYVGRRSMGALEFEPAEKEVRGDAASLPLDMAHLVEDLLVAGTFLGETLALSIIAILDPAAPPLRPAARPRGRQES